MATLTISEGQTAWACQYPGDTCTLHLYYNAYFLDSDGLPVLPSLGQSNSSYRIVPCTIDSERFIHWPAIANVITTTDGTPNWSKLIGRFVDSRGAARDYWFGSNEPAWIIPAYLAPATTYELLSQNNYSTNYLTNAPAVYPTYSQMVAAIAAAVVGSGAPLATSVIDGKLKISRPADNVLNPIAAGFNEPIISGNTGVRAMAEFASLATAISGIGTTTTDLLIPSNVTTNSATIPSTLTPQFDVAGRLTVNSAQTVTMNSVPELAPGRQRFFGTGDVILGAANRGVDLSWWANTGADSVHGFTEAVASLANTQGGRLNIPTGTWTKKDTTAMIDGSSIVGQGHTYNTSPSVTTINAATANVPMFRAGDTFRQITFESLRLNNSGALAGVTGVLAQGAQPDSAFGLIFKDVVFNNLELGVDVNATDSAWQLEDITFWQPQFFNCTTAMRINTINSSINSYGGNMAVPSGGVGFQFDSTGQANLYGMKFGGAGTASRVDGPQTAINFFGCENEGNDFFFVNTNSQITAPTNLFGCIIQSPFKISAAGVYTLVGVEFTGSNLFVIDPGIAARVVAINCPGFDAALVDNSGGNAKIEIHSGTDVQLIQETLTVRQDSAASTPLLRLGSTVNDKIALEVGQFTSAGVSINTYKLRRSEPDGGLQWTATQAFPNKFYGFDSYLKLTEVSALPVSAAGLLNLGANTGHRLQYSINGGPVMNVVGASTVMTANRLQKALADGNIGNSIISDNGTTVSWTGNLSVTGAAAFTGALSAGATALGATTVTTLNASGTATLAATTATSLGIGSGGSVLTKILKGTVTVDPASIAPNTVASQTFTLAGAVVGDALTVNPPAAGLTAGLLVGQCFVSAANTITIVLFNTTVAPIDEASASWTYQLSRS